MLRGRLQCARPFVRLGALTVAALVVGGSTLGTAGPAPEATPPSSQALFSAARDINPRVLDLALSAANCARRTVGVTRDSLLTIIDYSRPSTRPRMWVLDIASRRVLYEELVAHGRGSGDNVATRFSNSPNSHQSSLGLFRTASTYVGRNGYSLRLDGLEPGVNDAARARAIVMHGADYVSDRVAAMLGRLGRSHGCPALRDDVARQVIDTIKDGSLVFAYYPDQDWLATSRFLGTCGGT